MAEMAVDGEVKRMGHFCTPVGSLAYQIKNRTRVASSGKMCSRENRLAAPDGRDRRGPAHGR